MRISDWSSDVCSSDLPFENSRVPAKTGTHLPPVRDGADRRWAPAFAGAHNFIQSKMLMRPSTASVDQASLWSPDPHPFLRPQGSSPSGCRAAPQPFVVAPQHRRADVLLAAFDPVAQPFGPAVGDTRPLAPFDRNPLVPGHGSPHIFPLG